MATKLAQSFKDKGIYYGRMIQPMSDYLFFKQFINDNIPNRENKVPSNDIEFIKSFINSREKNPHIDDNLQLPNGIKISRHGEDADTKLKLLHTLQYMFDHGEGGDLVRQFFHEKGWSGNPKDSEDKFFDDNILYPSSGQINSLKTDYTRDYDTTDENSRRDTINLGNFNNNFMKLLSLGHEISHAAQKAEMQSEAVADLGGAGYLLYKLGLIKSPAEKISPLRAKNIARLLFRSLEDANNYTGTTKRSQNMPLENIKTAITKIEKLLSNPKFLSSADPNEIRALTNHLKVLKDSKYKVAPTGDVIISPDAKQLLYHNSMMSQFLSTPYDSNWGRAIDVLHYLCPERFDLNGNDKLTGKPVDFNLAVQSLDILTKFSKKRPKYAKAAAKRLRKALLLKKDLKSKQVKSPSSEVKPVITRKPFTHKIRPNVRKRAIRRFNRPVIQRQPIQNAIPTK